MDLKNEFAYQRACNFKLHQRKLKEIKKSPTRRIDNYLPPAFLNKKKRHGYQNIWWNYQVQKDNKLLLEKLLKIREKKKFLSINMKSQDIVDQSIKKHDFLQGNLTEKSSNSAKSIKKDAEKYKILSGDSLKVVKKTHHIKLSPIAI